MPFTKCCKFSCFWSSFVFLLPLFSLLFDVIIIFSELLSNLWLLNMLFALVMFLSTGYSYLIFCRLRLFNTLLYFCGSKFSRYRNMCIWSDAVHVHFSLSKLILVLFLFASFSSFLYSSMVKMYFLRIIGHPIYDSKFFPIQKHLV